MDPGSIFSIIAGSAGLALQCSKLVRDLHDVTDMYKNANLTVVSLSTGLETIQWAWGRIEAILETWTDDQSPVTQPSLDTDTFQQLNRSLEAGRMVIAALEKDLMPLTRESAQGHESATGREILNRVQVIWNTTALRDHQERIRDQMNSMTLMISVLKLPDALTRRQSLNVNVDLLRKSDESAHTIVPSRLSISNPSVSSPDGSLVSEASESSLIYRELAFDDDLFTARVYKRNYRPQKVRQVKQAINNENSTNETPNPVAVSATLSNTPRTAVSRSSSATSVSELPVTSGPSRKHQSDSTANSHWVVTGWIVPNDIDDVSFGASKANRSVPGPMVPRKLFEEQRLSEWGTNKPAHLNLLHGDVIKNVDWKQMFETSIYIPRQWLQPCLMAACIAGSEGLTQLILRGDPKLCSQPFKWRVYGSWYPIDVAYQLGHMTIVKIMLGFKPRGVSLSRIRKATHADDTELLAAILEQYACEYICKATKTNLDKKSNFRPETKTVAAEGTPNISALIASK
ncbi:MAG: hypothetical protein L6R36_004176 [Xanthoria steineri]|nr:MAG: hypothetical protein L6R36_004176 [Xanthoria steineri]